MPTADRHLTQAARNESLSLALEAQYSEWAVTALFYAALHYVEAYFDRHATSGQPRHHTGHVERTRAVRLRIPTVYRSYRWLMELSRDARYECVMFTPADVRHLRRTYFEPLKADVRQRL